MLRAIRAASRMTKDIVAKNKSSILRRNLIHPVNHDKFSAIDSRNMFFARPAVLGRAQVLPTSACLPAEEKNQKKYFNGNANRSSTKFLLLSTSIIAVSILFWFVLKKINSKLIGDVRELIARYTEVSNLVLESKILLNDLFIEKNKLIKDNEKIKLLEEQIEGKRKAIFDITKKLYIKFSTGEEKLTSGDIQVLNSDLEKILADIKNNIGGDVISSFFTPGSDAEWGRPQVILMHTPERELFCGVIHPQAALFERCFDMQEAFREHRQFIKLLQDNGSKVYTLKEILLAGTIDKNGNVEKSKSLDDLRVFAKQFLKIDASHLPPELKNMQSEYLDHTIEQLSPQELVDIIFHQPTVHLYPDNKNTGLSAKYEISPLMNAYFLRDQMITTKNGIVIANLNSPQRAPEIQVIKFALKKLGIKPIYEVSGKGRLEGGDFLTAGEVSFIGQGLRTNAEGVKQLLDNNVFGSRFVAVVKDSWCNQEEMHLDTYFNIISPKLAVLVDLRMNEDQQAAPIKTFVDVYEFINDRYRLVHSNLNFRSYLEDHLGFKLIPVSRKEQNNYGINFLTVAPNKIFAVQGSMSEKYKKSLEEAGIQITWVKFDALTGGYGAAHCTTQPIVRK